MIRPMLSTLLLAGAINALQLPFTTDSQQFLQPLDGYDRPQSSSGSPLPPRLDAEHYAALPAAKDVSDDAPPKDMKLFTLHKSGSWKDKMDLTFFSDGCESHRGPGRALICSCSKALSKHIARASKRY